MPIKLIPPRKEVGQTSWYGRGTHLGVFVDRSTKTDRKAVARKVVQQWEREIERDLLSPQPKATFLSAAVAYLNAGGDPDRTAKLIEYFGEKPLADIGQQEIDNAAAKLYPTAAAATRNREVYTPLAAILHRAGVEKTIKRPKGWRGNQSTSWLEPEQAFAVFDAADAIDPEFGLLVLTLCYTGMRLGEALNVKLSEVSLKDQRIYLPTSKNGRPRAVYLPMHLVAAFANQPPRKRSERPQGGGPQHEDVGVAFMDRQATRKLFRFHAGGALRDMLKKAFKKAKLSFPRRQGGFHIFCHTYGTWMTDYGNLDAFGLTRTGRWVTPGMAHRYSHSQASEEARRADMLPTKSQNAG